MSVNLCFINSDNRLALIGANEEIINLTHTNAGRIVAAMGIIIVIDDPTDIDINTLINSAKLYLSSELGGYIDNGKPWEQTGNWIEGGLRAGYYKEKISLILDQANKAKAAGATHAYFI